MADVRYPRYRFQVDFDGRTMRRGVYLRGYKLILPSNVRSLIPFPSSFSLTLILLFLVPLPARRRMDAHIHSFPTISSIARPTHRARTRVTGAVLQVPAYLGVQLGDS